MSWILILIWYYTISKHCKFLFESLLLIWRFLCWSPQLLHQLRWHMPHKKLHLLVCQLWGVKTQLPERSPLHDWKPSVRGTAIDGLCCQSLVNCSCSLSPPLPAPVARASPRLSPPVSPSLLGTRQVVTWGLETPKEGDGGGGCGPTFSVRSVGIHYKEQAANWKLHSTQLWKTLGEETETETEPTFGQLRSYVKGGLSYLPPWK